MAKRPEKPQAQPPKNSFRERVQALIDRAGSRYKLAKQAGIAESTIQNWIGGTEPSTAVVSVADAMGVELRWLLTGEGNSQPGARPAPDYETLRRVIARVETNFPKAPAAWKARAIVHTYQVTQRTPGIDESQLMEMLRDLVGKDAL